MARAPTDGEETPALPEEEKGMEIYLIRKQSGVEYIAVEWWSKHGWTDITEATIFTDKDGRLPIVGDGDSIEYVAFSPLEDVG
jgi:hypothetical protein